MTVYRRPASRGPAGDAIPFGHDGVFHLFHLQSPNGAVHWPERVRTSWAHARSQDLVTWVELPLAVSPGDPGDCDSDGAWTGSVIAKDGVFHLFYTGHQLGSETPQTICRATSDDLVHFTKDRSRPLLAPDTTQYEPGDWRDPFVFWNEEAGTYWMLIAARLNSGPKWRRGAVALATSPDLDTWEIAPDPLFVTNTFCPECPEMFKLGDRWYLVYSRFSEDARTIYRTATSSRGPWRIPAKETLDGRRWYAAKSVAFDEETRVFFGWIHDREGHTDQGDWLWAGDFAAPRLVTAEVGGGLSVRLPDAVVSAYSVSTTTSLPPHVVLGSKGSLEYRFFDLKSERYLFSCAIKPESDTALFGLLFRMDDDLAGYAFTFDRRRDSAALIRWPQPLDKFWSEFVGYDEPREVDGPRLVEEQIDLKGASPVECRLIVDESLVELYVNDTIALSYRVHGRSLHELGLFADDGAIDVANINLREL